MMSVNKSYLEPNDYPINIKSRVYSGVEYWKQKDISLMDNAGLPYDNMVIDYEDDDTFKGNKGFMCQYDKSLNFETVWSSIFDLDSLVIYRAEGNPRRCKFINDERLKKK